ncbi:hypothetical protein L484_020462 [Morus notabilis]|uniref:Classical arabinogalactan protein 26 n=1 Tax=Morus notabilis TaxID=981085 RepID=W9SZP4_9ROSA|nr:classical arabinogalactan protein 26 [Morus notabilis]EXC34693.1 hypothetical protein L484_020462 [Morus notabilis]
MASFESPLPRITIFIAFITFCYNSHYINISFALASQPEDIHDHIHIRFSTISAAPAVLPGSPISSDHALSPTLSPDITPLFPTPRKEPLSPSESSLPTIPSSPSPPNPDGVIAPGPGVAFPPSGSLLTSTANSPSSCHEFLTTTLVVLFMTLVVSCAM